ncbi:MAG: alcohol dehydrogenase [Acetobacteraceae bacterium]|nr:alcohol dehydrogenase [Acetobacteraceae bacterium]
MENFTYHAPTKILFGKGQIANLRGEIPVGARVLMTYGGGSIRRNGVYEQVKAALQGFTVFEFGGIEPNPAYETLEKAIDLARESRIDFLLAVGGGSVIDGTKFVAAALRYQGDPWTILADRSTQEALTDAVPLGCVLTLPATGSEMNAGAVISRRTTGDKLAFHSPYVIPRFSVLDPLTTFSLPARQVANGVVDAFVHVTEQYLTFPVGAKVQDRFAEGLLQTLVEIGPQALQEPPDYAARANLMWAATMALNGLIGVGVPGDWATHMIGHELTAKHGLDHGQTLAIVLPAMLTVRRAEKRAKLLQYAARVWGITEGSEDARIDAAIAATRTFFERMGLPTHLSAYGISRDAVPSLLAKLKEHGMTALGEHQAVTLETSRRVLDLAA